MAGRNPPTLGGGGSQSPGIKDEPKSNPPSPPKVAKYIILIKVGLLTLLQQELLSVSFAASFLIIDICLGGSLCGCPGGRWLYWRGFCG